MRGSKPRWIIEAKENEKLVGYIRTIPDLYTLVAKDCATRFKKKEEAENRAEILRIAYHKLEVVEVEF